MPRRRPPQRGVSVTKLLVGGASAPPSSRQATSNAQSNVNTDRTITTDNRVYRLERSGDTLRRLRADTEARRE